MLVDRTNGESGSFPGNLPPPKITTMTTPTLEANKKLLMISQTYVDGEPDKYELFSWDVQVLVNF